MTSMWVGERVRLRAIEPADLPQFAAFDADTRLQRFSDRVNTPRSQARYEEWAKESGQTPAPDRSVRLAIARLSDDLAVGAISTHNESQRNGCFGYGLALGAEHHRLGYATEAVRMVLGFMFRERRFHKAEAGVWAINQPSLAFHRAFGFVEEGRVREHEFLNGQYVDEVLFGLTVPEFEGRYPRA